MGKRQDQGGWESSGFGERLKEVRERAGLTQKELAERAGIYPTTLSKLERGQSEPAWPLVLALARVLNVPADVFRPEADRPRTPADQAVAKLEEALALLRGHSEERQIG